MCSELCSAVSTCTRTSLASPVPATKIACDCRCPSTRQRGCESHDEGLNWVHRIGGVTCIELIQRLRTSEEFDCKMFRNVSDQRKTSDGAFDETVRPIRVKTSQNRHACLLLLFLVQLSKTQLKSCQTAHLNPYLTAGAFIFSITQIKPHSPPSRPVCTSIACPGCKRQDAHASTAPQLLGARGEMAPTPSIYVCKQRMKEHIILWMIDL